MWDREKAVEAILYLANRLFHPTKLQIFKLLYLADKLHLSRYGRFVIRDQYVAMKHGPVPSRTHDLLKSPIEIDGDTPLEVARDGRAVHAFRDANLQKLSQSDIECLEEIVRLYRRASTTQLIDLTHDALWDELTDKGERFKDNGIPQSVPMPLERIVETLPNADEIREYLIEQGQIPDYSGHLH